MSQRGRFRFAFVTAALALIVGVLAGVGYSAPPAPIRWCGG